jgi:aldehyde dehydrogenase (NAD+)
VSCHANRHGNNVTSTRFINNEFVKAIDGNTIETINPTTEEVITAVQEAKENDVNIAVAAARKAFEGPWRNVAPQERGKLLVALSVLVENNLDLLSSVESLDNGKAFTMAKVEVKAVAGCLRYYGGWADKIEGKVIDTNADTISYTRQEPVSCSPRLLHLGLISSRLVSVGK